jgi:hypothetical protein
MEDIGGLIMKIYDKVYTHIRKASSKSNKR